MCWPYKIYLIVLGVYVYFELLEFILNWNLQRGCL